MLTNIQTRIKPLFGVVGAAVNLREAIKQPIHKRHNAYVTPISDRPTGNSREPDIGQPFQETIITFGVVIGFKSINDPTGEKALAGLAELRKQLRESLHGWKPADKHEPILLGAGDVVGFANDGVWWLDRFSTVTWYLGSN